MPAECTSTPANLARKVPFRLMFSIRYSSGEEDHSDMSGNGASPKPTNGPRQGECSAWPFQILLNPSSYAFSSAYALLHLIVQARFISGNRYGKAKVLRCYFSRRPIPSSLDHEIVRISILLVRPAK
jgi:hypothetical protein